MPSFIQRSAIVTGAITAVIPLLDISGIESWAKNARGDGVTAGIGFGLWVAVLAGVIAIVGGLVIRRSEAPES